MEEIVGLRQAFVSKWTVLHEQRCRIVGALCSANMKSHMVVCGTERPAARAIVHTTDLLVRLRHNLCEDHVAGVGVVMHVGWG